MPPAPRTYFAVRVAGPADAGAAVRQLERYAVDQWPALLLYLPDWLLVSFGSVHNGEEEHLAHMLGRQVLAVGWVDPAGFGGFVDSETCM